MHTILATLVALLIKDGQSDMAVQLLYDIENESYDHGRDSIAVDDAWYDYAQGM
jgi:hypothetical protein